MRYQALYGITDFLGGGQESAAELWRRELFEPTCTICGLNAGYHGQGPSCRPRRGRGQKWTFAWCQIKRSLAHSAICAAIWTNMALAILK